MLFRSELVLDRNELDDGGGKRTKVLREFIAGNGGLQYLSMNQCNLGEEGAGYIA